jgi:hypothetical protein
MLTISHSFASFVFKEIKSIRYLAIAFIAMILQIVIFKVLYPYGDFFSDSYSYIFAAAMHQGVSIWPIGYAKFLSLFHLITYSDTVLVAFQYLFVQITALYFFFTLLYFYRPATNISSIIFAFLFFNPLILYISNYISSDALFLGLSLIWLTQLIWIINRPKLYQIFVHALIIALAFAVRYNAMYYPIITALAFILSRHKIQSKIIGIILPLLLIGLFVNYTRNKAYELTGTKQFSVFGGWQIANNALYMYPFIEVREPVPPACQQFHNTVKTYFSIVPDQMKTISPIQGAFYIKFPKAPLKQYLSQHFDENSDTTDGVASWGSVAPVFGEYGTFLIKQHPIAFARYFLLPNAYNYFLPPLEKLEVYNLGDDHVGSVARHWFHYPHSKVKAVSFTAQGKLLLFFPAIFITINILLIGSIIWWIYEKGLKRSETNFTYAIVLVLALLLINAAFGILASPIVFRYQIFPMIIFFSCAMLIIGQLGTLENTRST